MYDISLRNLAGELVIVRIGDEIVEPGIFAHKMTFVGPIGPNGENVFDPAKGQSARFVYLHSIPNLERLRIGQRGSEDQWEQAFVQNRALEVVAKGIVNQTIRPNCEHLSSYVRTGKPESPQLQLGVGAAIAIFLLWLFA